MSVRQCPHCKSYDVHRSHRRGLFELMSPVLLIRPYRCWVCFRRHYGLVFKRRIGSQTEQWSVFTPVTARLLQGASALLVLLGLPFLLASSGPALRTLDQLAFTHQPASHEVLQDQALQPIEPMQVFPGTPADAVSVSGEGTLFATASLAPQREPVSALRTAGEVYLNETKVPAEATIFPGDTVRSAAGGSAALDVPGKGKLLIAQRTQVSIVGPQGYFAALKQGAVSFHSNAGVTNFEIQIGNVVIAPDPAAEAAADIERAPDGSARIKATQGSVGVIALDGTATIFLRPGQEAFVSSEGKILLSAPTQPAPSVPQPAPSVTPPVGGAKGHTGWIILGLAGGGGAGVAAALATRGGQEPASPSTP